MALKYLEALMIKERHSGADRVLPKAGSGVFTKTQPHDAIKCGCILWSKWQRNLSFSLLTYFVAPETKPRASPHAKQAFYPTVPRSLLKSMSRSTTFVLQLGGGQREREKERESYSHCHCAFSLRTKILEQC